MWPRNYEMYLLPKAHIKWKCGCSNKRRFHWKVNQYLHNIDGGDGVGGGNDGGDKYQVEILYVFRIHSHENTMRMVISGWISIWNTLWKTEIATGNDILVVERVAYLTVWFLLPRDKRPWSYVTNNWIYERYANAWMFRLPLIWMRQNSLFSFKMCAQHLTKAMQFTLDHSENHSDMHIFVLNGFETTSWCI